MAEVVVPNLAGRPGAPAYEASETLGPAPRVDLRPTEIPHLPNEVAKAVGQFGDAAQNFFATLANAKKAANATTAVTDYLVGLDKEKTAAVQNQDWQNAPQQFSDNVAKLQADTLGQYDFDPETAAKIKQHFTLATIPAAHEVQNAALLRGTQKWEADYTTQSSLNQTAAATAATPAARQSAVDRNDALIATGINAGWISTQRGADLQQRFRAGVDHADAIAAIAADPRIAAARLADPNDFVHLSPAERETYLNTAREKVDQDAIERARGVVAGRPYVASLIAGQFVDGAHIGELFERGVVPAESGGVNQPPNAKGAFGIAQITPAFARDYATRLPAAEQAALGDISKLSDQELTAKLMDLPTVAVDIGKLGFADLAGKYGGNVPLTLAAYNAGPKNADRWQAEAVAKFGPSPTPAQILSVVDFPETRNYIAGIYAKARAPLDAYGVSPAGRYHLGTALGSELQAQAARDQKVLDQVASVEGATDPVPKLVTDGVDVSAERIAAFRTAQSNAAAGGDVEAARRLHELDLALSLKPQIDRLYRMPFAAMNAAVDAAVAQARTPGANLSADDQRALEVMQKTRDAINAARTNNPTSLLVRAGLAKNVPLDTAADPNDPGFRAALTARGGQAVMAQKLYGGTAMALTPAEQDSLKQRYASASPPEQFQLLRALAETLPQAAYDDTIKAVTGDTPGAAIVGRFAATRPDLAEQMLQGAALLKSKETADSQKALRPAIAGILKTQLYPSADQQNAVVQAALYLDAARRNARGALYDVDDTSGVRQAVEDVAGRLTVRNGLQVAAPPGMQAGQFAAILDGLDDKDVARAGGAYDRSGQPVTARTIADNAILKQQAPGSSRYWVGVADPSARDGFAPYFTAGELPQPLVFDMAELKAAAATKNRITEGDTAGAREARARAAFATQ
ncbi:MAG TPA: transglycosylase SLT domain-containing protein [Stellaceae bacterium]|nr:transglycosylase SLT domain-containing protein [Stellaceae bacterium]